MKIRINTFVLIVFIMQFIASTSISLLFKNGISEYLQIYITQLIPIFIPTLIYCLKSKKGYIGIKRDGKITPVNIILVICMTVCINFTINVFSQIIYAPVVNFLFKDSLYNSVKTLVPGTTFDIVLNIIFICILPAFFEELLFRGVILTKYEDIYGSKKAIIMCGLTFALLHGNLSSFVPQFVVGVFISYIVFRFNSIYYGIIAHLVHNVTTLILHISWNNNPESISFLSTYWFFTLLICICVIYFMIALGNNLIKNTQHKKATKDEVVIRSEGKYFKAIVYFYIMMQILALILNFV